MWYRNKYFIFILIVIAVIIIGNTELHTTINDRAVAVGIALDREDDKIKLAAQIMTPSSGSDSGAKGGSDSYSVVSAEGDSISEAIDRFNRSSSLKFSPAHVGVIIIGKALAEEAEIYDIIKYLLTEQKFKDTVYLVRAEDKAEDVLKEKLDIPAVTSVAITKALNVNRKDPEAVYMTIKDFFVNHYSGGSAKMPLCKIDGTIEFN